MTVYQFSRGLLALVVIATIGFGCSVKVTDVQQIPIDYYDDGQENKKLAEDLMFYNTRYIAHHVPSLDEKTGPGIRLGYHVTTSGDKVSYQITYRLDNPAVAENHSKLKEEFAEFIPRLAETHIEKEPVFETLKPMGEGVAHDFFGATPQTVWNNSSELMKSVTTKKQFLEFAVSLKETYGEISSVAWLRGQFYQAYQGEPETLSLYFTVTFENGKACSLRASVTQESESWALVGFGVQPLEQEE